MHPIERLRFVARAQGVPGDVLAMEATAALMTFADDPAALVAGCRRVLSRQPGHGQLWWACARLLTAEDLRVVARETIALLEEDTTEAALSIALFDEPAQDAYSAQLVRAHAIGDGGAIVDSNDLERLDRESEQTWLVAGVGMHLNAAMWASLVEHWSAGPSSSQDLVPIEQFTHFVGPDGPLPMVALGEPDCPTAPELFRLAG